MPAKESRSHSREHRHKERSHSKDERSHSREHRHKDKHRHDKDKHRKEGHRHSEFKPIEIGGTSSSHNSKSRAPSTMKSLFADPIVKVAKSLFADPKPSKKPTPVKHTSSRHSKPVNRTPTKHRRARDSSSES